MANLPASIPQRTRDVTLSSRRVTLYRERNPYVTVRKAVIENIGPDACVAKWQESPDGVIWSDISRVAEIAAGTTQGFGLAIRKEHFRCVGWSKRVESTVLLAVEDTRKGGAVSFYPDTQVFDVDVYRIPWNRYDGYTKVLEFTTQRRTAEYAVILEADHAVRTFATNPTLYTVEIHVSARFDGYVFAWFPRESGIVTGRAPFVGVDFVDITFGTAQANANYAVFLTPSENVEAWVSNITTTGFRINVSTAITGTVHWAVRSSAV